MTISTEAAGKPQPSDFIDTMPNSSMTTSPSPTGQNQNQQQQQPSKTVRRHPNAAEPSRAELLKYLACLEGELAARDAAIESLRRQRQEQLLQQARNGRYGLADPYAALQRDSEMNSTPGGVVTSFGAFCESDVDEAALKSMYDSELAALENLIEMQSRAQQRMREQINQFERRYRRVCAELEVERRKHEKDAAEGDDVLAGLEKERERLRSELEFERQQSRKLDREVGRVTQALADERALSDRQRRVALSLIRDRRALTNRLSAVQARCDQLERAVSAAESAAAAELEAAALSSRVEAEQRRARELGGEVDRLRALLAAASHPASQPGGLLKVKPEPPVRRTPGPTVAAPPAVSKQQQQQQQVKSKQQQQQQQHQINDNYDSERLDKFSVEFLEPQADDEAQQSDTDSVSCTLQVYVRLPRLGSLPIICLAGVRQLLLSDSGNDEALVQRAQLSLNECADQLLRDCFNASDSEVDALKTRCYEVSGPAAGAALRATISIAEADPTTNSQDFALSAAAATAFPLSFIRHCQSVLSRHSCLILAGPLHCGKRHLARHLAETMQRRAQLDGASIRQLSHDCLDWESFDAWLAACGIDAAAAQCSDDSDEDEARLDESGDGLALGRCNSPQPGSKQPQTLLLLLHRLEFVLDSPSLASLLWQCRRSARNLASRRRGGRTCQKHQRLILLGSLGCSDLSGVPQSLLLDAVADSSCWCLLSVLDQPLTGLLHRSFSLRWRQLLAESAIDVPVANDNKQCDRLPELIDWIANLPEQCNRCLLTMSSDQIKSLDCPVGPTLFIGCPVVTLCSERLEELIPHWFANLWNTRLLYIVSRTLGLPSASSSSSSANDSSGQPCRIAEFIRSAIASQCPLREPLLQSFLASLIGYQPESFRQQQLSTDDVLVNQTVDNAVLSSLPLVTVDAGEGLDTLRQLSQQLLASGLGSGGNPDGDFAAGAGWRRRRNLESASLSLSDSQHSSSFSSLTLSASSPSSGSLLSPALVNRRRQLFHGSLSPSSSSLSLRRHRHKSYN